MKISYVKQLISANIDKHLTVDQLAHETCVSYHHLRDIFLTIEGCPLKEYINTCRVRKAAELLLVSEMTLDEIAFQVGYVNKSTLSKAFKKAYTISPGKFRTIGKIKLLQ